MSILATRIAIRQHCAGDEAREALEKIGRNIFSADCEGYAFCRLCSVYQNGDQPAHADDCPIKVLNRFIEERR